MQLNTDNTRCNCCSSLVNATDGEDCSYCGYPIAQAKEQLFLRTSITNLERIARNGGAAMTILQLIRRYQQRLNYLSLPPEMKFPVRPTSPLSEVVFPASSAHTGTGPLPSEIKFPVGSAPVTSISSVDMRPLSSAIPPMVTPVQQSRATTVVAQGGELASSTTRQQFSWKTFLSDQTINIVALLGAFLILVGSLSFVITTSNTFLSFLVVLAAHAVFGITGVVTRRLPAFRMVSFIYTTIFSLQVPLVGFSAYQNFILRNEIQLDISVLIAIIAFYAAVVYGLLAIYLKFSPFAYLSVICLAIVDLAICRTTHLEFYWWPSMLMLLAFPSLAAVYHKPALAHLFAGSRSILCEPVRVLMWIYVALCAFSAVLVWLLSLSMGNDYQALAAMRFFIVGMLFLLMVWFGLFVWLAQRLKILPLLPYCLLADLLALGYALAFDWLGYAVLLTGVALLYHGLDRCISILARRFGLVVPHVDAIVLAAVAIVPLLATPALPLQIFLREYSTGSHFDSSSSLVLIVVLLLSGLGLTISVLLRRTGWPKALPPRQAVWCRLLWLAYFQLTWIWALLLLEIGLEPFWGFLGLALVLCALTVIARRFTSSVWANVLDGITLCSTAWMLLFSPGQDQDTLIVLLLGLATLAYSIICYQCRPGALLLPVVFLLLACFPLAERLRTLLILSVLLPLLAGVLYRFLVNRQQCQSNVTITSSLWMRSDIPWCWPLLLGALLYSALFFFIELTSPVSTLQNWSSLNIPLSLELAGLAILWYIAAVLARVKSWLLVAVVLALIVLVTSNNDIQVLIWLAPLLALLGVGVSRLSNLDWAAPFYVLSLCVAFKMGIAGPLQAIVWPLLLFATLVYLLSFAECHQVVSSLLRWCAVPFACWSTLVSALLGNLYCPPIVAITCATIGMGIGCLCYILPAYAQNPQKQQLLFYVLPLYTQACFAAVLTGIYGVLIGTNSPFFAAIPTALYVYALVAFSVCLFERRSEGLWMMAVFAIWGTLLLPRAFVCSTEHSCQQDALNIGCYLAVVVVSASLLGWVMGRLASKVAPVNFSSQPFSPLHWGWPWYLTALVACGTTLLWTQSIGSLFDHTILMVFLGGFVALALLMMLLERAPEVSVVVTLLATWAIAQVKWPLWEMMSASSLLCVMLFALQFVWRRISVATGVGRPSLIHQVLGIGGQILVVLVIIFNDGLVAGPLAHVGAISLAILALLIIWYGFLQVATDIRHLSFYGAGLLLTLVVSWELLACDKTHILLLSLAPATYFIVVAPFLAHDEKVSNGQGLSQFCSSVGALLLLLPTLWLSFVSDDNLLYTLILAGESLLLFLLGLGLRVRFFILSGTALVIISAIHLFFLSTIGIPPFLVLTLAGFMLLVLASVLLLIRSRIVNLWRMPRG